MAVVNLLVLLFGVVIGWCIAGWRVSKVVIPYLDAHDDEEAVDFCEQLFFAVAFPPLAWWVTRKDGYR